MDRSTFLGKTGLACLGLALGDSIFSKSVAQTNEDEDKIITDWIKDLLANLEQNLPDSTRQMIYKQNGRACARRGAITAAQAANGDLKSFINTLRKWIGAQNVIQKGNRITIRYDHCFCPIAKNKELNLPPEYCQCSIGWLEEMFTTVTGRPVQIQLISSILNRAGHCEFDILV